MFSKLSNMLDGMAEIHRKIEKLIERNGSLRKVAATCGINHSTLSSALVNEREIGYTMLQQLSAGLNVPFQFFAAGGTALGFEEIQSSDPFELRAHAILDECIQKIAGAGKYNGNDISLQAFLDWWYGNSGRLENFDALQAHVDLFDEPDTESGLIQPKKVGRETLASICFEIEDASQLKQTLNGFSNSFNAALVDAHMAAIEQGEPVITHPTIDEPLLNGRRFVRQYRRVLAPVFLRNGTALVCNFSQDIKT